jgi:cobalt-zinc-cadmium resistance protein CzcA
MLGISLWILTLLGGEFIPTLEEGDLAIETRILTGSSIEETIETATKSAQILIQNFPEVIQVIGKIGTSEIPTDPMPLEACDLIVELKDKSEWTSAETTQELVQKMNEKLSVIAGASFSFQQPIQMRFNELMTGAKQDIAIKIYGEDLQQLLYKSLEVKSIVKDISGVEDVFIAKSAGLPQIVISYDRDKLAKYGISIAEANRYITMAFAGQKAGNFYEGEKIFDLVIRLDSSFRNSITDLNNIYIYSQNGEPIPINLLAKIEIKQGPNQIDRENTMRIAVVSFNVRNRDIESVIDEIKPKLASLKLLPGYRYEIGGQFKNLEDAKKRLAIALPIALLLIFGLLYFTFYSVNDSLLIFTAVPFSAIGGILALWFRDMAFSISAGVGFITLFGVSVLNGIVLISEFKYLEKQTTHFELKDLVLKGVASRIRPVLMTALVASLGFLPMSLATGSGAEIQKPLATVVIGGLVSSTILTLFILPMLYILIHHKKSLKSL